MMKTLYTLIGCALVALSSHGAEFKLPAMWKVKSVKAHALQLLQ